MSWRNSMLDCERYTYTYFHRNNVCRLCWSTDGVVELTYRSPKSFERGATIAEKILECVGINVTTQTYPNKICLNCLNEIEVFIKFKRFCQRADGKLQHILKNGSSQPKKQRLKKDTNNYNDLMVLEKESVSELTLLSLEVKKEENLDKLILKQDIEESFSDFKLDDSDVLSDDLLLDNDNYCYSCHLDFESNAEFTAHNLNCHKNEDSGLFKYYGSDTKFQDRQDTQTLDRTSLTSGCVCKICNTYLLTQELYESHLKSHKESKDLLTDNSLMCSQCSKLFETSKDLKSHMITHKNKKSFVCEICGRVFNRRGNMNTHKLTHTRMKMLQCPHCDHRATHKSALSIHLRVHTGERPFACDQCPHSCSTSSNLIRHKNLKHLGIKDFKCQVCDKLFRDKCSLNEHIAGVHDKTKIHTCNRCGVQYFRFRSLREHLLIKHGRKIRKVKDDFVEVGLAVDHKRKKIIRKGV